MAAVTDEMVGWHHQLNGHEFEQALRVGDGQGLNFIALQCFSKKFPLNEYQHICKKSQRQFSPLVYFL